MEFIYTIGHSTQSAEAFVEKLQRRRVDILFDVRSVPFSHTTPQFDREKLKSLVDGAGIKYLHMGKALGARTQDSSCYENGRVVYERLAQKPDFKCAIARILDGAEKGYRLVLMCAEKEPLDCHRTILVSKALARRGASIMHILIDGSLEHHEATMNRLIDRLGKAGQTDFFLSETEQLENAYRIREREIAFKNDDRSSTVSTL